MKKSHTLQRRQEPAADIYSEGTFILGHVLDNTVVGLCYMKNRHFIWANARMAEIFGYRDGELNGQDVRILYATQEDYEEVGLLAGTFARESFYTHERAMVKKSGDLIWCLISGRMVAPDEPDSPSVWVVQDISDRKSAEDKLRRTNASLEQTIERRTLNLHRSNQALKAEIELRRSAQLAAVDSREKYRALFKYLPLGLLVSNASGEVIEINRTLQINLGTRTKASALRVMSDQARVRANNQTMCLLDLIKKHSATNGRVSRFEFKWMANDREYRDISVVATPLSRQEGGTIFTFSDITRERQAQTRDRQQQVEFAHASRLSLMGQTASALAHELGQPLNACQSYLAGLKLRLPESVEDLPDVQHALNKISEQLYRAGEIVRNMRSFSSRQNFELEAVEPVRLIDSALGLLEIQFRAAEVHPVVRVDKIKRNVLCRPVEIQQVLVNLLINATEAMENSPRERRTVTIRLSQQTESRITFEIEDNGPGIAEDVANHLFTPYFTTKAEGLGMGLVICRTLIEAHGEAIRYQPAAGGGARFVFTLKTERQHE